MTEASVPSSASPGEVLTTLGDLTRKVRTAQRGTWFPLLLLGLLLTGGIAVDRLTFHAENFACAASADVRVSCIHVTHGSPLYWTLGLAVVYAASAFFYIMRARRRGVGSVVRPYAIAGIVILLLVAPTRFWTGGVTGPGASVDFLGMHFQAATGTETLLTRLTGRAVSVGVPLLVLSWIERNRELLLFTGGYLVIELVPITVRPGDMGPTSPWSALPGLAVPAAFLLAGALWFALTQRPAGPGAGAGPEPGTGPGTLEAVPAEPTES